MRLQKGRCVGTGWRLEKKSCKFSCKLTVNAAGPRIRPLCSHSPFKDTLASFLPVLLYVQGRRHNLWGLGMFHTYVVFSRGQSRQIVSLRWGLEHDPGCAVHPDLPEYAENVSRKAGYQRMLTYSVCTLFDATLSFAGFKILWHFLLVKWITKKVCRRSWREG